MTTKKILVTGVSGLIGKSVVKALLADPQYIVVGADLRDLDESFDSEKFSFVKGNFRDYSFVESLIVGVDGVIHLAAPSSFLMYKETPRESTINTVECMLNILEAMKKHKVKKIVHASTSAVYEGQPVPYNEDMVVVPPDLKALSKKFNEEMAQLYSKTYGITAIHMRPFSVYGEGEIWKKGYANVISLFAWAMVSGKNPVVWGDGSQTRDFIHAEDAARVFKMALESDMPSQPLNVGTGVETTFNEVIAHINKILGTDLKPEFVDVPIDIYALRLWSNNEKLEKNLSFKPSISAEEGIERVVRFAQKYIAEHPERANDQMYFETLPER